MSVSFTLNQTVVTPTHFVIRQDVDGTKSVVGHATTRSLAYDAMSGIERDALRHNDKASRFYVLSV